MAAGSIVRLKLKNFMTYNSMEITPCPGLNLITGPNGTGKSTILCAMCLSLGGKPSSIGRSEKISDFIKTGYDQAYIEIELLNPDGRNIVIGRLINSLNTSNWTLNGKASSLKMVEKEIAKFNIQTNNLCQFLPQEKVSDFSKMNQKDLLESTEQAVGDQSMYDNHMKLKEFRSEYCELEANLNSVRETLQREEEMNKRLEGEITLHKEREKHVRRKERLKKKIPWMKYKKVHGDYVEKGLEKTKLGKEITTKASELKLRQNELDVLNQQVKETEKVADSLGREIRKKNEEVSATMQRLEGVDSKVSDTRYYINEKIKDERERLQKLQSGQTVLRNYEEELRDAQAGDADTKRKLEELSNEAKDLNFKRLEAEENVNKIVLEMNSFKQCILDIRRSVQQHQQQQQQRINILRTKEPDAYKAVEWLRHNQHMFKKKIYEPIFTLINVPDHQAVKYIENNIAYRDLMAFFAEDPDDMNLFLKILCDDHGYDINGIHSPSVHDNLLQPRLPAAQLRNFGLSYYLKELFSAPPIIMKYLCKQYRLHEIPVRYEYDSNVVKNIHRIDRFPFNRFYVGNIEFRLKTSKYGNRNQSSTSQKIGDGKLLKGSLDASKIDELEEKQQELENSLKDKERIYSIHRENGKKLEAQIEELRKQKKILHEKRDNLKNLSARANSYRAMLKIAELPVCNIEEEERRLSQIIVDSIQQKAEIFYQLSELFEQIFTLEKQRSQKEFVCYFLIKKKAEAGNAFRSVSSGIRHLEQSLHEVREEVNKLKGLLKISLNEAKASVGLNPTDEIPPGLKKSIDEEFKGLPNDVAELETEICREQAKLNCISQTNPQVLKEYTAREENINETKRTISTKESKLQDLDNHINSIRDQWLPAIETLMEKISDNFSRYFASIGCAGEVTLDKTDNPNDFEKYGLSIKVKFRNNEPLTQLSHAHHSGGECSVSTILFILSLQELTEVPFRCVDEINQGMDNNNERSVFDLIVKSSCSKKKSQYFLITPKLLQGLDYPTEMEIAIIHNGSSQKCHWNIAKFLSIRSSLDS